MITGKSLNSKEGEESMKNKMISRMIAVILAGCMILSTAGCGNNATVSNNETSEVTKTSEKEESAVTEKSEEEFTYPMDTDVKLSLWSQNAETLAACYSSYEESPYHLGLAENTGIDIEWIFPDTSAGEEAVFNLMLTDKELPDMFVTNTYYNSVAELEALMDGGVILDLTDLIPKYAPNYWAYLNEPGHEYRLKSSTTEDGRLFGVQSFRDEYCTCYTGPVIRQDWLDACGLNTPVTMEQFEEVLRTFHEEYDAVLTFRPTRVRGYGFASGTGAYTGFILGYYLDENGKVQCANLQPEWKEYLETLHRWYEEGLLDPEFATMDDATVRSKIMDGKVGMTFTAMSQLTAFIGDAETAGTGAVFAGLGYPRVAEGEPTSIIFAGSTAVGTFALLNAKLSEEEVIAALRWCDYGFTDEGNMYKNFGTLGESYVLDENGEPTFTELVTADPDGVSEALMKYTGTSGSAIAGIQSEEHVKMKNSEVTAEAVYTWVENTKAFDAMLPTLNHTEEEAIKYSDLVAPLDTYIEQMALKYITGEEDFAGYDEFMKTLTEMGIQETIDINQAAYDRFMNR